MATDSSSQRCASGISRTAPLLFALLQILTPMLPSLGFGEPIGDRSDLSLIHI